MDKIIAAIGSALRAISTIVWVTCKVTGRLIMQLVPDFGAAQQTAPVNRSTQRPRVETAAELARPEVKPTPATASVKMLAQKMAAGTVTMTDMHAVDAEAVKWLASLDHQQLCRLICIEDLGGYMAGRAEVRGLPKYLEMTPRPSERRTVDRDLGYVPIAVPAI